MPPISHIIYIPSIFMFGIVLGYILANQAHKERMLSKQQRQLKKDLANAKLQQEISSTEIDHTK